MATETLVFRARPWMRIPTLVGIAATIALAFVDPLWSLLLIILVPVVLTGYGGRIAVDGERVAIRSVVGRWCTVRIDRLWGVRFGHRFPRFGPWGLELSDDDGETVVVTYLTWPRAANDVLRAAVDQAIGERGELVRKGPLVPWRMRRRSERAQRHS